LSADLRPPLKIGSLVLANPLVLAPLSGISDLPFRILAKEQGCALVFTEMISAEGLSRKARTTLKLLKTRPQERPLGVQIFGPKAGVLAEAAKVVEDWGGDVIDINMGCPVRKVVHGGSGAALLKDPLRIREILEAVRRATRLPFTVKIRLGWDERIKNFLEVARIAQDCGVDAVIVHGRTRSQGYGVKANWDDIRELKERIGIPVIGNGALNSSKAVLDFFAHTQCDGAMIGRGAFGNPWIFAKSLKVLHGDIPRDPSLEEKKKTVACHLQMMVEEKGEIRGVRDFRKHLIWYTRGMRGSVEFRARLAEWCTLTDTLAHIQNFFENSLPVEESRVVTTPLSNQNGS